jgi:hypothetical protein
MQQSSSRLSGAFSIQQLALSSLVLVLSGLVVFFNGLAIGFWTDDFTFAEFAARLSFPDYLSQYFDPRMLESWYRPVQGMQWWVEYQLFHADPVGYHVVNLAFHIIVCWLIMILVAQVTRRLRLGFLAGFVFLVFPIAAVDVLWVGVADPMMTMFYLITCWFWLRYLQSGGRWRYVATLVAFVATLLSKEMGVTIIAIMFLCDILLVPQVVTHKNRVWRYVPFALILVPYMLIEYYIQMRGVYVNLNAYRPGMTVLPNLVQYMKWLVFPWNLGETITPLGIAIGAILIVAAMILSRSKSLLFVVAAGIVATAPVLPFPISLERYIYVPLIASAILFALGFEFLFTRLPHWTGRRVLVPVIVGLFLWWNSSVISAGAFDFSELARVTRLQFRPLYQKYTKFEQDTLLYFVEPPFVTPNIGSIMYLRYGENAHVYGTDRGDRAHLRERANAIVVYFDDQKILRTQSVDREAPMRVTPEPPQRFADSIVFEGFEIAQSTIKRGDALALVLYWRIVQPLDTNYTVFVHVVDQQGRQVAGIDSEPHQGNLHTSNLRANYFIPDGYIIPITQDIPTGEYKIMVGLYRGDAQNRLPVIDANGQPFADHFVLETLRIIDK